MDIMTIGYRMMTYSRRSEEFSMKKSGQRKPDTETTNIWTYLELPSDNASFFVENAFAIVLFSQGSALIESEGSRFSIVAPGCFCFNERSRQKILSSNGLKYFCFFFSPSSVNQSLTLENIRSGAPSFSDTEQLDCDFLQPFLDRSDHYFGYIPMGPLLIDKAVSIISALKKELSEKPDGFWPCRSRSHLLELLFLIFKVYHGQETDLHRQVDNTPAGKAIHYIHCNYADKISVDKLCERFETNKTTLNRAIRQFTGCSVIEYVNKTRIQNACLLLRDTSLPVLEILYRSGFNDTAHFGRIFKKYAHLSPSEYRRKATGG
jgi:AraC-like DNA-binding protein